MELTVVSTNYHTSNKELSHRHHHQLLHGTTAHHAKMFFQNVVQDSSIETWFLHMCIPNKHPIVIEQ